MKPPAVIFDRDGTLASCFLRPIVTVDPDNTLPFQRPNKYAWAQFNAAMPFDAPVPWVAALLRSIRPGVTRIMTSGRMAGDHPGDRRRQFVMQDWLVKHSLPIDVLHMRDGGDTRVDSVVKRQMYLDLIAPFYDVRLVVDDRPSVCDMWRDLGLHVLQVSDPDLQPPILGG